MLSFRLFNIDVKELYCVKSDRIWSFSGPYFHAFGLNTERYSVFFRIQSKCGKIWTRKAPNTDTCHVVSYFSTNHQYFNVLEQIEATFSLTFHQLSHRKVFCEIRLKCIGHCVKKIQLRSFFDSVFSRIRTRKKSIFGHFSCSGVCIQNILDDMFWTLICCKRIRKKTEIAVKLEYVFNILENNNFFFKLCDTFQTQHHNPAFNIFDQVKR